MKKINLFIILLIATGTFAQTVVSGIVTDAAKKPIEGANVYLEGTYDGASTDAQGYFSFETTETGTQNLLVSMLSFEPFSQAGDVTYLNNLEITLYEALNELTGVTLTAGSFKAGDNSKASVLKPLDIVTTAGTAGDFVAALRTLPGTSTVNEDGRLFVRGGAAGETQVFIDGLRVFQPFNATTNNMPTRGRFSPFLFKGITFSTGGYSAEYGQALSSVLLLNTTDIPDQEKTDISIMSVGAGLGHTEIWGKKSLSINTSYTNLGPYQFLVLSDQDMRWNKPYESVAGEAVFRSQGESSMFKFYTGFNHSNVEVEQQDINFEEYVPYGLKNNNFYLNSSYKNYFENEWTLTSGASISIDKNNVDILENSIDSKEVAAHLKTKLGKKFSNRFQLMFGAEYFNQQFDEQYTDSNADVFSYGFKDHLFSGFAETDIYLSNQFAMKLGGRLEKSNLLDQITFSPRMALAYKSSEKGQFSLAYGDFYQNPWTEYLKFDQNLETEKTSHYILNYQFLDNGKTFRAEAYYKNYDQLVKFDTEMPQFNSIFNNSGGGYASGLDIFWRDNKSIGNLDYWVSYSFLDTQRNYRNFKEKATPNFAPKHSLSLVTKYWIEDLRSQVGISYNYGSGRMYNDPNKMEFQSQKAKAYNNLSVNWAYLLSQQKILYFSISNVAGFNNVNGYQYANTPNDMGTYERRTIRPNADTFFFVGFFWTISQDKKSNQLDNL
ncbi:TonB-dependent receptor [Maribacter cobaltidurans]|uniref:TonB-dependent receptor n=1 Tax=Maribacter cobaltidurans TaxID=1178778 RepID=A0A223V8Y5_9FLAO|nr:TonB-dependent receptor [Maribacter cobaltidurans]ASV31772.1 TonB-dependent receptor [Maribacter cobaltidurans]GGD93178.1 TonB-dependent receptor [Maribacter cobaltidurans]